MKIRGVGDMGVDGRIYPVSSSATPRKQQEGELGLKERWYPIQVKQKDKVGRPDIDAFEAMMMREDCENGFFVSFDYSSDALQEIESFFKRSHKVIVAFTVKEILTSRLRGSWCKQLTPLLICISIGQGVKPGCWPRASSKQDKLNLN